MQLCFGDSCRFATTSQDRVVTNGLTMHDNSSGVTTARRLDTDAQIANVDTQKLKVALDPHCCSNSASQLVARPPQNIACDGLLCTGMDSSAEREKVECCVAAVIGLPTSPVIDWAEPIMLRAIRHLFVSRVFVQVMRTISLWSVSWIVGGTCAGDGQLRPVI